MGKVKATVRKKADIDVGPSTIADFRIITWHGSRPVYFRTTVDTWKENAVHTVPLWDRTGRRKRSLQMPAHCSTPMRDLPGTVQGKEIIIPPGTMLWRDDGSMNSGPEEPVKKRE